MLLLGVFFDAMTGKTPYRMMRGVLAMTAWLVFLLVTAPVSAQSLTLRVIVLHGYPGHTGVHLTYGNEQYYWDPGGNYGQELDECQQTLAENYCRQWYAGFPWDEIKAARRHDVLSGRSAGLMQVLAVEVLDYESPVDVFTFRLTDQAAQRAWQIIQDGAARGGSAAFTTSYPPMLCARAVSAYLRQIGGPFGDLPSYWRPEALARALRPRADGSGETYTLHSPPIQSHINAARRAAGHGPLPLEFALTGPDGGESVSP